VHFIYASMGVLLASRLSHLVRKTKGSFMAEYRTFISRRFSRSCFLSNDVPFPNSIVPDSTGFRCDPILNNWPLFAGG
jgi:hypothetical protein